MSARSISSSSAMDLVAESESVLSTPCSPLSRLAWPPHASANGRRSPSRDAFQCPPRAHWASRRSSTVTDWPRPCWPRNSRSHRQAFGASSTAAGRVSRHNSPSCSTHAHDRDPRGPLNPHILPDAPLLERERLNQCRPPYRHAKVALRQACTLTLSATRWSAALEESHRGRLPRAVKIAIGSFACMPRKFAYL